jgi:phosphoserine aminotransferase
VAALVRGWRMLSAEQQQAAMDVRPASAVAEVPAGDTSPIVAAADVSTAASSFVHLAAEATADGVLTQTERRELRAKADEVCQVASVARSSIPR